MYPGTHAATTPDKPAAIMADTGETVTYAQLEERSVRIARVLHGLGLRRGDHLAVVAANDLRIFDVYWAAKRSGLYLTMVNSHLTPAEIAYIVEDCGARALVVDAALAVAPDLPPLVPQVEHLLSLGRAEGYRPLEELAARESPVPLADQPRGADMLYSSGTTGRPKGILPPLPEEQVDEPGDRQVASTQRVWGAGPEDVYLSPAPLYHAAPLRTCTAVQALGGTVVVMRRFDAEEALALIERYRVTYSQWVPTMFVRMLKLPEDVRARYDVSSLRLAVHAAAPCPPDVKRRMIEWWGPIVDEYYSSTELNGMTVVRCADWLRKPGTVGRAVLGVVRICADDGRELPVGEVGTVYFERDELPFRYHNAPEKTRAAQHPHHPTWTTTGDLGRLDEDGFLFLSDRRTFLIISGGVNIYPQEIENVLGEHPAVLDAAVIGVPDEEMGESVLAVVQTVPGRDPDESLAAELLDHVRSRLARFKTPRRIVFSRTLPRTPTGKLAKGELRDLYV
ncbi:acyl-CoA synthetase [Pseudonocardia pini]|uniref:acyl-CoA synthetase n=1 Tax=Pseudonocardia pini TaxID=2758030 RepID=UPI0015F0A2D8|nr:acyl-CoA synthetase [Pseudonocardia pini]